MSDVVQVDPQWARQSHCDNAKYLAMYERSGYSGIERYNDNPYAERWFEKQLTPTAPR